MTSTEILPILVYFARMWDDPLDLIDVETARFCAQFTQETGRPATRGEVFAALSEEYETSHTYQYTDLDGMVICNVRTVSAIGYAYNKQLEIVGFVFRLTKFGLERGTV